MPANGEERPYPERKKRAKWQASRYRAGAEKVRDSQLSKTRPIFPRSRARELPRLISAMLSRSQPIRRRSKEDVVRCAEPDDETAKQNKNDLDRKTERFVGVSGGMATGTSKIKAKVKKAKKIVAC